MKKWEPWRSLLLIGGGVCALLAVKYILPVATPFLLGLALALGAEPLVKLLHLRLGLRRGAASAVGVTLTLVFLLGALWLLCAAAVRELVRLTRELPDIQQTAKQGITQLEALLTDLAQQAPSGVRPLLTHTVTESFQNSSQLMDQAVSKIPSLAAGILGWIPKGALTLFTALLSGFLISGRLPRLRVWAGQHLPPAWKQRYLPALAQTRKALGGWLKAQGKLCLVTWGILSISFFLLKISYAPLWAALIALVDAVPILGTGTVVLPWAAVCLLQGNSLRAIGLLCTYGAALLTRTVLEPRLVGKQLGLDPLVTLIAFYTGFTLWGFWGMLLAPVAAAALSALLKTRRGS